MNNYIYNIIIPQYAAFDAAHREDHAMTVIDQAMKLLDAMPQWLEEQENADTQWLVEVDRNILKISMNKWKGFFQ